jgi:hypothetical protein
VPSLEEDELIDEMSMGDILCKVDLSTMEQEPHKFIGLITVEQ